MTTSLRLPRARDAAMRAELEAWRAGGRVRRLWTRDATLWPGTDVLVQITCDDADDLAVTGQRYSFGVVKTIRRSVTSRSCRSAGAARCACTSGRT